MAKRDKLDLTREGAQTLRDFAQKLVATDQQITEATEKLQREYRSVSDDLGSHENDFREIVSIVSKAQKHFSEAVQELPPKMRSIAAEIDKYVASRATISGTAGKK